MKDVSSELILTTKNFNDPRTVVDFCLKKFCDDNTKNMTDDIIPGLTYEEVIGALVLLDEYVRRYESKPF